MLLVVFPVHTHSSYQYDLKQCYSYSLKLKAIICTETVCHSSDIKNSDEPGTAWPSSTISPDPTSGDSKDLKNIQVVIVPQIAD